MRQACSVLVLMFCAGSAFPVPREPIQYWQLNTGSHIAYMHYQARPPAKADPIILLHGGPGAFIVDHSALAEQFYQSLAHLGYNVYLYDQIGSGHSTRLPDPRLYTVKRHINDLEAIRQTLQAQRLILIGDSWGATLGASYIAEHPDRCAKAIFSGPGAIDGSDIKASTYADAPVVKAADAWFAKIFSQPRYEKMRDILTADVVTLYRSIPERELDAEFDDFVHRTSRFLVCDPEKFPADAPVTGMGWWANLMTSADLGNRRRDLKPLLAKTQIPVLILRGGCDYLRWEVAYDYKLAFPNATLIYVPDAGHLFGYDQPKIYSSTIEAFLQGRTLPIPPYTSATVPRRVMPRAEARNHTPCRQTVGAKSPPEANRF